MMGMRAVVFHNVGKCVGKKPIVLPPGGQGVSHQDVRFRQVVGESKCGGRPGNNSRNIVYIAFAAM